MTGKRWFRRLGITFLLVIVGVVLLLATYAYWLPWAARPIAKRYGITFNAFERMKDGRFAITDVVRTNKAFDLKASRIEGFLPHVWRTKLDQTNMAAFVEVNGWRVAVHERAKGESRSGKQRRDRSVYEEWERA